MTPAGEVLQVGMEV